MSYIVKIFISKWIKIDTFMYIVVRVNQDICFYSIVLLYFMPLISNCFMIRYKNSNIRANCAWFSLRFLFILHFIKLSYCIGFSGCSDWTIQLPRFFISSCPSSSNLSSMFVLSWIKLSDILLNIRYPTKCLRLPRIRAACS